MVGQAGMPGNEEGGGTPRPADGSLQPPVFDPPLSLPAPQPADDDGDPSTRKRVLWAFGAAAALFGAGVVGLALPNNPNDGVNVSTEDTAGPTTAPGSRSEDDVRTLVAPVFAPFTFSVTAPANTTTSSSSSTAVPTTGRPVSAAVLAGVVARGTTSIRLTPLPPVTNSPPATAAPNSPSPATPAPTTGTTGAPATTRPPRPPRTTTTTLPTTPPTDPPTTETTIPTTPPTDPPTTETTIPTTPPTDPPTTETTTTAGTTTTFETPTSPETTPTTPPATPPPT